MSEQPTDDEKKDVAEESALYPSVPPQIEFSEVNPVLPSVSGTINNPDEEGSKIGRPKLIKKWKEETFQDVEIETDKKEDDMVDVDIQDDSQPVTQYPLKSGVNEATDGTNLYQTVVSYEATDSGISPEDVGLITTGPIIKRDYGRNKMADCCGDCCRSLCLCSGICCCCYWICVLCCLCILLVILLVVGVYMLVIYIECVSGVTNMEQYIQLNHGTTSILFDHYGSFQAKSSNGTAVIELVIRSHGKKGRLPNYDYIFEESLGVATITQKHLYDNQIQNEAFGIICEGFDVELIIPATANVELVSTSRLYGNMSLYDIKTFKKLVLDVSQGKVEIDNVRISGDFEFTGKYSDSIKLTGITSGGETNIVANEADTTIINHKTDSDFYVDSSYGSLWMTDVTVSGSSSRIKKRYGSDFSAKNFYGSQKTSLTLDFDYADLDMDGYYFSSVDVVGLGYCTASFGNGEVVNDMTISTKYSDVSVEYLTSEKWGTLKVDGKYDGDMDFKYIDTIDFKVTNEYGDVTVDLEKTYYGKDRVAFDLEAKDGDVKIVDTHGHLKYTEDTDEKKTGYINKKGEKNGKQLNINNKYGDITLQFLT